MTKTKRDTASFMYTTLLIFLILSGCTMTETHRPGRAAERPLVLKSTNAGRVLSPNFFGVNAPSVFYERILEMPQKHPIVNELAPGHLRFPGGTIGNYYDWRDGMIKIPVDENSSRYSKIMSNTASQYIKQLHKQGVHIADFTDFSKNAGAEVMLLVNMETSSVEDQVAWFKEMHQKGIVPKYIELGNEFWIAMLGDPNVMKKFPNVAASMKIMKEYLNAIRPYLPDDVVIAAQSVGHTEDSAQMGIGNLVLAERLREWDRNLQSEPWYDALTIHMYPEVDNVLGDGAFDRLPHNIQKVFPGMMAQADEGTERIIHSVSSRFPDKEIWVSEWSPQGVRFFFRQNKPGLSGLMIHQMIRMNLTFLRLPAVTKSTFHMLSFREYQSWSMFAPAGGSYVFAGPTQALQWFHLASRGQVRYETLTVDGSQRFQGRGSTADKTYADVAAARFVNLTHTTILVHNIAPREKAIDISSLGSAKLEIAETMKTPDLMKNFNQASPSIDSVKIENPRTVIVPAYSFTRLVWRNN